ncbi:hypothetical protein GAO09_19560 [Rhizobiales bacterium RZME27]|uniref:Uncharacterized protein n=2 Tax=Endobacterium cereale TaxID=2663029 RepID=A0A6A8AAE9_9HYPH|nr:hypothetical protein [Endobacterium cereale]
MNRQTVTINGPEDRQRIATWARNVDEGTIVEFRKKTRSHEQSAKMHAMLGEVANQVVWYGTKLKVEDWKNMFTASLRKAQVVPGIDPGTVVPLGIHTSTMTVDEMSNMIEAIYAFGADPEHPVTFKEPQPDTNSGSPSPEADDAPITSSAKPEVSPASGSPISPLNKAELIECCRKLMEIPAIKELEPQAKRSVLEAAKDGWKETLHPDLHDHLKSFFVSADAQIKADPKVYPSLRASAFQHFAEVLDCKAADIGGEA